MENLSPSRALPPAQMQIGDRFLDQGSAGFYDHVDPATGKVQARVPLAGNAEVEQAVAAAKAGFEVWRKTPPRQRRDLLNRLADLLIANADELVRLSCLENGTAIKGAVIGPHLAAAWTRYYAGWADKLTGQVTSTHPTDQFAYTVAEPYGVVGIIITWNGPLISLGMKVAPALAAGNSVVIKPSEMTPWAAGLFGKLVLEAGIPPGVVNILPGGPEAGEALVTHPEVLKISFTGGPVSARKIQQSSAAQLKPLVFELGGKSANLLFADADIERAVENAVMFSIGMMSGQGCAFPTRLLVERSVYDDVVARVEARVRQLVVGDPLDPSVDVGPVVNQAACERIMAMVEKAKASGECRLVVGGERASAELVGAERVGGFYVTPTVFADVKPGSELAQQEVFGPVLCLTPFDTEEEAVAIANSTEYGLAAYIQTKNLNRALRLSTELCAGTVCINGAMQIQPESPFGGERLSGHGREGGREGLEEFLRTKTVSIANANG